MDGSLEMLVLELLHFAHYQGEQGHAHDDAVEGFLPVAGPLGYVHIGGNLIHAGQRVQQDGVRFGFIGE